MRARRENLFHLIEPFLSRVEHPSRYLDHEWGACEEQEGPFHLCMVYADVYEVGQPNLGVAILYNAVNAQPDMSCERCYLPWRDMAALMRERGVPLLSLEGSAPLASFDAIGFTLAHELIATNVLEALDLAGIALTSAERDEDDPIILAGGPSAWNCEPLAPALDAVLLGDGEESIVEACACIRDARAQGVPRAEVLRRLARVPGTYVPSLYDVAVDDTTTRWGRAVPRAGEDVPEVVRKRCLQDFAGTPAIAQRIVPYMGIVQDRLSLEVLRGCARGCRFCQAGMTYRPVRERPAEQVVSCGVEGLLASGHNEISLTSLSTTDHSQCEEILVGMNEELAGRGIRVSIPSQRLDSFGVDMAAAVAGGKRGGLTFAPEAGSQRLRDVINKNVTEDDLERAARNAFAQGLAAHEALLHDRPSDRDGRGRRRNRSDGRARARDRPRGRGTRPQERRFGLDIRRRARAQGLHALPVGGPARPRRGPPQAAAPAARGPRPRHPRLVPRRRRVARRGGALQDGARGLPPRPARLGSRLLFRRLDERVQVRPLGARRARVRSRPRRRGVRGVPALRRASLDDTSPGVAKGYLQREWLRAVEGVTTPDCTRESCAGCGVCPALGVGNVIQGVRS